MSAGFSAFIIIVTLANIVAALWLLWANTRARSAALDAPDTGHVWDEDLMELNRPMPRWWLWLFVGTVVLGVGYLVLFPGLGRFPGLLDWTQAIRYRAEVEAAEARQAPFYRRYAALSLPQLAADPAALSTGRNLFALHCAGCHGSDGRGAPGFPNLTDDDWLYGGQPEAVLASIREGRIGVMPAWQAALGEAGVDDLVAYVRNLSGHSVDPEQATAGATRYAAFCVACHGPDGRGSTVLGAPNLTDDIWLYGGSDEDLRRTIAEGRQHAMPAHRSLLGEDRVRLLAAWVLQLANDRDQP